MNDPTDGQTLQPSAGPRGLKSVACRCLFALLKLIRRIPRVLHTLLALALSAICVMIISVWVVLSFWKVLPRESDGVLIRGIGGEIGSTKMSHFFETANLETYWLDRVTAVIRSNVCVKCRFSDERYTVDFLRLPVKNWDTADLEVSFPIENLKSCPSLNWSWSGFWFGMGHAQEFTRHYGGILRIDLNHRQNQMERTGLSEQELLRIANLPRLWFSIKIPLWFCVLVTGWYPLFLVVRGPLRRRRRARRGWCIKCGYDLTGNESGVCPECGKSISPKSRSLAPSDNVSGEGTK